MTTPDELANRLGRVSSFKKIPFAERLAIILAGEMRHFPQDCVIFSEREPSAGMFVLLQGHVHICMLGIKGQQNIIADIDPVIMFNEVSLLDGGPNPYTAFATQSSFTWHISRAAYSKLLKRFALDRNMEIAMGLIGIMTSRYRQLLDSYADLSFLTVPSRVAKLIYELSDEGRIPIDRSENSIFEMAAHIASVPEAISRSLNILKSQGIIKTTRSTISVLEPHHLLKLARPDADLFIYRRIT